MRVNGELVGATPARRRRERRLRSWWRHEALSVAAALATARHHSAGPEVVTRREGQPEEVDVEQHDGLRAQTTPPPGTRPGVPLDPGPPVVGAVTVGYVAAPGPLLAPPVLAGGDGLDEWTLAFLVQQTLLAREKGGGRGGGGGRAGETGGEAGCGGGAAACGSPAGPGRGDPGHSSDLVHPLPRRTVRRALVRGQGCCGEEEGEEEEEKEEEEKASSRSSSSLSTSL